MPNDGADCHRQVLADIAGPRAAPQCIERPFVDLPPAHDAPSGFRRQVEAQQAVVALRNFLCDGKVPELLRQSLDLVVEHIGEALEEEEGQQVVLELGRVLLAANGASSIPQHLFHGLGGWNVGLPAPGPPPGHACR